MSFRGGDDYETVWIMSRTPKRRAYDCSSVGFELLQCIDERRLWDVLMKLINCCSLIERVETDSDSELIDLAE